MTVEKPKLLLHSCCGPCSTAVIERLFPNYEITLYFYNPNIDCKEEYEKRKRTQTEFLYKFNELHPKEKQVEFLEGNYNPEEFYKVSVGLEALPEGGARCETCFRLRLGETARVAKQKQWDFFGTTLTVSPHKNYASIAAIGQELQEKTGIPFLDMDFKKKGGYQRSIELSKEYQLYRQNFCGCSFARRIQFSREKE